MDSLLQYVFIKSIAFSSPAFHSGQFACGDQLVMVGSECLMGMSLLQAKQVLEQAPPVVELVAQRKESPKQSPALAPKMEARAPRIGREESREDVEKRGESEKKRGESEKIKVPSLPVTELPTPPSPLPPPPTPGKTGELRPAPQFSQTISQSEMQTRPSRISTSLAYATGNVNLNASWNVSMSGT